MRSSDRLIKDYTLKGGTRVRIWEEMETRARANTVVSTPTLEEMKEVYNRDFALTVVPVVPPPTQEEMETAEKYIKENLKKLYNIEIPIAPQDVLRQIVVNRKNANAKPLMDAGLEINTEVVNAESRAKLGDPPVMDKGLGLPSMGEVISRVSHNRATIEKMASLTDGNFQAILKGHTNLALLVYFMLAVQACPWVWPYLVMLKDVVKSYM